MDMSAYDARGDRETVAKREAYAARRDLLTLGDALQGEFDGTLSEAQSAGEAMRKASADSRSALEQVESRTDQLMPVAVSASCIS